MVSSLLLSDRFQAALIVLCDQWKDATGDSDSQLGKRAVGDTTFVTRLRTGKNVTVEKCRRLELWLKQNLHRAKRSKRLQSPELRSE